MRKRTNLVVANQVESLRTTVPNAVVDLFGLEGVDQLEWVVSIKAKPVTIQIIPVKMDLEKRAEMQAKRKTRAKKRRATIAGRK